MSETFNCCKCEDTELATLRARLAKAEAVVRAARRAAKWLHDSRWGNFNYMEGSEIYGDIENHRDWIETALAAYDAKETPDA